MIDKESDVNYNIQLVGRNKAVIVHSNKLKLYYGNSPLNRSFKSDGVTPSKERQPMQPSLSNSGALSNRTFAEVVAIPLAIQPTKYIYTYDIGQTDTTYDLYLFQDWGGQCNM